LAAFDFLIRPFRVNSMQITFDPSTGAPSTGTPDLDKAVGGATVEGLTVERSEFENGLATMIQESTVVQWLRAHPLIYHASAATTTVVVAVIMYAALRTLVFLPLLRFLRGHGDGKARGAQLVRAIHESKIVNPLAWILPFLVAWRGIALWPGLVNVFVDFFGRTMLGIAIAFGLMAFARFLAAVDILVSARLKRPGALRGYVQAISAIVYVVGGITIIAISLGRSPIYFLTGVGAFAAILAVILKDTLVSMFANIQMTTGDTLRVGDWVEMKQHAIDGRVEAISLTATRIRNWDQTTLNIPNSRFVSEVFVNYRTDDPRGGRRLRRTVRLDQRTVRQLGAGDLAAASRLPELARCVEAAEQAAGDNGAVATNLSLYRAYAEQYLARHPKVDRARPIVVRQHEPSPLGVPIEILAFFFDSAIGDYETLQATVLDHLVAVTSVFGLRIYQTGSDPGVARETSAYLPETDLHLLRPTV